MSAVPALPPDHRPESERHDVYGPWTGLVVITLRNVSRGVVFLNHLGPEVDFYAEVVDSSGQAVARTESGKHLADPNWKPTFFVSVFQSRLVPLEEITIKMSLDKLFQIEPGHAYKVTLRRFRGFPTTDEAGKPLKQVEISCSFEVPEYGILR